MRQCYKKLIFIDKFICRPHKTYTHKNIRFDVGLQTEQFCIQKLKYYFIRLDQYSIFTALAIAYQSQVLLSSLIVIITAIVQMQGFQPCENLDWPQGQTILPFHNWSEELYMIQSFHTEFYQLPFNHECEVEPVTTPSNSEESSQKSTPSQADQVEKDEIQVIQLPLKIKRKGKIPRIIAGCKCIKTSCLKSYCECYSEGGYCSESCGCTNCKNNVLNFDLVESARNKLKGKTDRFEHYCQCKKSKCQKKYCECFEAGVPCGSHCKCNGCKNCEKNSLYHTKQTKRSRRIDYSKETQND